MRQFHCPHRPSCCCRLWAAWSFCAVGSKKLLHKRVALVTGGARGIGRSIADDLAKDHSIALTWHNSEPSQRDAFLCVRADFSDPDSARSVIDAVIRKFGRIDVIVNNAAEIGMTPKETYDPQAHRRQFDINYLAPVALLNAALPHLQRGASIVSISSINAVLPPRDAVTYGATKAALNLWTRAMAKELGPSGIRVNAIAPGAINIPEAPRDPELTAQFVEMTALGRAGVPEDVAKVVRFLASDAAGFITGTVVDVSGGYRL